MALAMRSAASCRSVFSATAQPRSIPRLNQLLPVVSHYARSTRVQAAELDDAMFDEQDILADLPMPIRRRVLALRQTQQKYDDITVQFIKERAELEAKYQKVFAPVEDERAAIVAGTAAVPSFDLPDNEEADNGIPEFWLTAMSNHEAIGGQISDRDAEVLGLLRDIRAETLTGDQSGFKLTFHFAENPFFTNQTLEKTYFMEPSDELIPQKFVGTEINWLPNKDTRVQVVKKRVQDRKLKGKAPAVTVSRTEPCDSFFNFFYPEQMPENPDDLSDEQLEELQEKLDQDYEVGAAIREQLVPRAVEWYTGEAAPMLDDEYGDEFDEFEE